MLCQICKKRPANVHMTKIINGEKSEIHICEQCAKENEVTGINKSIIGYTEPFSFSNILEGLMDFPGTGSLKHDAPLSVKCPVCGLEYEEFKKTGMLGCSECYKAFGDRIEPIVKRIHGNVQHTGKVPRRTGGVIRLKRDIERLKYELKVAVDNEEYEKAAKIRDKIRELNG